VSSEIPNQSPRWPVWGHAQAVSTLSRAIAINRVRHAYLIDGPDGVGKRALALAFAQALCCLTPPELGVPCGDCRSCRKITRGVHPDVQTFVIESQTAGATKSAGKNTTLTIETIREMSGTAVLRPVEGDWRVLIVDDAEMLQEAAQEALLKTLEEPPSFAVIVLLAADAEHLLPTVRSRCQQIDLALLPRRAIERALIERGIDAAKVTQLASASGGAPGWAIRALEQPKLLSDRAETLARTISWIQGTPFDRVVTAFRLGDSFSKRRLAVFQELEVALGVWRDALLIKAEQPAATMFPSIQAELSGVVSSWPMAAVHAALRSVRQCIADLEANVRPRLALEHMVLQWPTT
jgi:DNA polymerase-3 subunit delta'